MAPTDTMPWIPIMIALRDGLANALQTILPAVPRPLTVRHFRHRDAKRGEWPALSLRYVSSEPSSTMGRGETDANLPEDVMELSVDLVLDMELPPEADEFSTDDPDPTGFGTHGKVMAAALDWLFPDADIGENTLNGLVWGMRYDGTAPSEADSHPDHARLEERLTLFYRVRGDRPNILLTGN